MGYALAVFTILLIGVAGNILEYECILWPSVFAFILLKARARDEAARKRQL